MRVLVTSSEIFSTALPITIVLPRGALAAEVQVAVVHREAVVAIVVVAEAVLA
jgi:hypothetical protein